MFIATSLLSSKLSVALAAAALVALSLPASAQSYPSKPVKVVVGYSAGGAVDTVARAVGQALSSSMGQPFVVDNKPGAGTNIAVKSVIAAEPDGHTLMLAANALAANMALYQPAPFDAERDLVAPAATPKAIVTRLHAEAQKALQTKEVRERMTQVGGEILPGSAEMFAALIRSERQRYEKLVREANIKPD